MLSVDRKAAVERAGAGPRCEPEKRPDHDCQLLKHVIEEAQTGVDRA